MFSLKVTCQKLIKTRKERSKEQLQELLFLNVGPLSRCILSIVYCYHVTHFHIISILQALQTIRIANHWATIHWLQKLLSFKLLNVWIRIPKIQSCPKSDPESLDFTHILKKVSESKLFGNWTVFEYLKSKLVRISDTHLNSKIKNGLKLCFPIFF